MCDMIFLVIESISTVRLKIVSLTEKRKVLLVLFRGFSHVTSIIIGTSVWAIAWTDAEVFADENSIKGIRYDLPFCRSYRNLCNFLVFENDKFRLLRESNSWLFRFGHAVYHSNITAHTGIWNIQIFKQYA